MSILTEQETLQRAAARLNLTVKAQFVPFSVSRSKDQKDKNLNWKVTLQRDGRDIIEPDYSAGQGHCPAYNQAKWNKWQKARAIALECESGKAAIYSTIGNDNISHTKGNLILPDECDVIFALVMDSDVLNYSTFEEWAPCFGYDEDSRQAEKIYQACLAIALKLRAGLGEQALSELRAACQDY